MLLRARALHISHITCLFRTRVHFFSMAHWSATCLSSETSDTNLSILVDCDASRYLFNCGEATTRTLLQRKKGFRKFKAIFASGVDTERTSGLPGFLMTLADSGTSKINVYGPPGLNHYLASTRLYAMRESLSLKPHEISASCTSPVYMDENLSVLAIPTRPGGVSESEPTATLSASGSLKRKRAPDCESQLFANKKGRTASEQDAGTPRSDDMPTVTDSLDPSIWNSKEFQPSELTGPKAGSWNELVVQHLFPGIRTGAAAELSVSRAKMDSITMMQFNKRLPRALRDPVSLSYILLGALGRGKFDAAKAAALGLKPGPLRGKLAKGETVVTPEGKTITPEMVLGAPPRPEVMIFIDCPSTRHITNLIQVNDFERFQKDGEYPVHCMIHLAGPGVLENARYQQWLTRFGENVHHLVTGPGRTLDRIVFTSSAYAQLRLSYLDSAIFHVPKTITLPINQSNIAVGPLKFEEVRPNHFVAMKPAKAPVVPSEDDGIDLFHPAIRKGGDRDITALLQPKTIDSFQQTHKRVADEAAEQNTPEKPGDNVVVTPLGTSSAMPSKYRNVSAIIVQIPGSGSVLLDCGEGTLGQLRRQFGDDVQQVLRDIRCIFISHLHGDHHMGVSRLLSQRRKLEPACTSPVYLIANQTTCMYLQEYNDLEDLGFDDPSMGVRIIYSEHAYGGGRFSHGVGDSTKERAQLRNSQMTIRDLSSELNLASIMTVDVWHRGKCYGIVIKHRDDWSVVYSGDTRPTDSLVRAGRGATLLIHEATLSDDQAEVAALKAHSTIGQAIDVAKRMGARNVLLTHFSNRFPKTPQMRSEPTKEEGPVIAVAFDHASISIRDMWKMNAYLPAIEQSFLDSEDPEDEVVEVLGDAP